MIVIDKQNTIKWVIVYNDDQSVFHFMEVQPNQVCETGLPHNEVFDTEQAWIDRIDELKGEGYYQSQIEDEYI